jgi:hypothetical protein
MSFHVNGTVRSDYLEKSVTPPQRNTSIPIAGLAPAMARIHEEELFPLLPTISWTKQFSDFNSEH